MSNFESRRLNWFKLFAADSLLERLFQVIAPLYLIEFLIKFVSELGRTVSPFLLLSRLEFLWTNRSLSFVALYPFMHLKVNSANRTLYILSRLSHRVCMKTSAVLVSHDNSYTIRPALACSFFRLLKYVLLHDPQTSSPYVTDGNITFV